VFVTDENRSPAFEKHSLAQLGVTEEHYTNATVASCYQLQEQNL